MSISRLCCCLLAMGTCGIAFFALAQEKKKEASPAEPAKEAAAKAPKFVSAEAGKYLSGELVIVDAINHRGALRLDGDGPMHYFAMLPYGMVGFNGAPAELRDVPLGTHMHGYFHLPPAGEEETIPPHQRLNPNNHAITLEDDFSYYQRRGQAWKIVAIDLKKGKLDVAAIGTLVKDGINGKYTFDIDPVTRVWKERKIVDLDSLAPEQSIQLNLTWSQGAVNKEFAVTDIWLDEESRKHATEMQRRRHVRYQQQRWLPGWIDHIEHFDYGGAIITITLFGGMDQSLYDDMKAGRETGYWVAAAEKTLRTWFHRADRKVGKVLDWKVIENPTLGSSGIQLRLKFTEVLEGYRPGRNVRLKCERWAFVTMPFEERVKSLEEKKRSAVMTLP
ncbi:MAG: hypothetical protein K8T89_12585 [Planctomycetes bacterium]|nr:hypothetical protein [Planctomycetota bacterium]